MIKKGTIVVRTHGGYPNDIGNIYKVDKDNVRGWAYYGDNKFKCMPIENYRLATNEEAKAYNSGIRHIDDIDKSTQFIPDFVIDTGYISFDNYKLFCLEYNIPFWKEWIGYCKHYGVYNNEPAVSPIPKDLPIFKNLTKLKEFLNLNTKTNEKITTITTESRRSRKGSIITSSRTRQITIGVRYIGNKTVSRFKTKRIESSKISSNIISC